MKTKQEIGKYGEDKAVEFLIAESYEILERNWRFKRAEVDIICKKEGILVFVEVKTKTYDFFGKPEEAVTIYKENLLKSAAGAYMRSINYDWEIRFDIIAILVNDSKFELKHYKDVFF
jgi:putative endonuclease